MSGYEIKRKVEGLFPSSLQQISMFFGYSYNYVVTERQALTSKLSSTNIDRGKYLFSMEKIRDMNTPTMSR